ncbi:hypothetical protein WJX77_009652 [Trebouxia sp. C0004]
MCANFEKELQAAMSLAQITQYHWDDFRTEDDQLGQGGNCSVLACHSTALAGSMELCTERRLTVRNVVAGCHSAAAGLAACHSKGVIHQDIRAANILLITDGKHCKVADLGSAAPTHIGGKPNRAQTCTRLGVPETARGFLNCGYYYVMPQCDVWQLGLLLRDLTESSRPAGHLHCLSSSQFVEELSQGVQDSQKTPGQKAQLEYLAGLRDAGVPDGAYSDQFRPMAANVQKQLGANCSTGAGPVTS